MIRYTLKCSDGHGFESWFQSAQAYDKLASAGMVCCAVCGSAQVEKALMAPRVRTARVAVAHNAQGDAAPAEEPTAELSPVPAPPSLSEGPQTPQSQAMDALRKDVEANSDYVGGRFAQEARAMHLGDTPGRSIYGEARPEEAKALIEEGVPVLPLPFIPSRKTN